MRKILFASWISLGLPLVCASADSLIYHPMDADIIMPSYPSDALTNRIQGSVIFRVTFNEQKVESVVLSSSTLRMGRAPRRQDAEYQEPALVGSIQERLKRTILQWRTIFVGREEYQIEIRLKVDDSLGTGQRRCYVEYGRDSVVRLIELVGPGTEWERAINSPPTTK